MGYFYNEYEALMDIGKELGINIKDYDDFDEPYAEFAPDCIAKIKQLKRIAAKERKE